MLFDSVMLNLLLQKFACNGTVIEHPEYGEVIQLQGDQRKNICQFLLEVSDWVLYVQPWDASDIVLKGDMNYNFILFSKKSCGWSTLIVLILKTGVPVYFVIRMTWLFLGPLRMFCGMSWYSNVCWIFINSSCHK